MPTVRESSACIAVTLRDIPTKDMPVFYNPIMKLNRDITIVLLRALGKKNMVLADPLAGSGIRAIRMLKELPADAIKKIHVNDRSRLAVRSIRQNFRLNKIPKQKITITTLDARDMLRGKKFDYIDIDPFGSPGPFIDSALEAMTSGGILALTATDTAALCGSAPAACMRKYQAKHTRNWMMHELGLRILIGWAAIKAAAHKKGIRPVLSYDKDHYMRAFIRITGPSKASLSMVWLCEPCHLFGRGTKKKCPSCGKKPAHAGPLWTGKIGYANIVKKVKIDNQQKFLALLRDDTKSSVVGHYDVHEIARRFKIGNLPSLAAICSRTSGTRTHFNAHGIKTKKSLKQIVAVINKLRN